MKENQFYWQRTGSGGARLLRVYGTLPEVTLPAQIDGLPLTELGAYCFAENAHLPEAYERSEGEASAGAGLRELSGSYVTRIVLPDTLVKIGNLAFYNCSSLEQIELGCRMEETGSDAFMNCRKLKRMILRCAVTEKSGIRQILTQIAADLEVFYLGEDGTKAAVFYPEYYESYDEIAPAHLFGRNIEGEGFRARQAFKDGAVDLAQYDAVFEKACAEETEQTLSRMAWDRLRYPAGLLKPARERYERYLRKNPGWLCRNLTAERDTGGIRFLCQNRLLDEEGLNKCLVLAAESGWAEGSAAILHLKQEFFSEHKAERYAFDDF